MISDDTGISKIMILDKVANGIVSETPEQLLNGSWDEVFFLAVFIFCLLLHNRILIWNLYQVSFQLEDPTLVPGCITDLIGKDFTFGVYVEKDNVAYGAEIYKVGKIYKDRLTCVPNAITTCQSNKPLTITGGDEVPLSKFISIYIYISMLFCLNTIEQTEFDIGFN